MKESSYVGFSANNKCNEEQKMKITSAVTCVQIFIYLNAVLVESIHSPT